MSRTLRTSLILLVSGLFSQLTIPTAEARPFESPADPNSAAADNSDSAGDSTDTAEEEKENPDEWEIEPDFAPDSGTASLQQGGGRLLRIGSEVSGVLGPRGAAFRFYLARRQTVVIATAGPTDTLATLLDAGRRVVGTDDDSGPGRNCRLEAELEPGWYSLRLEGSWGSRGPYTLLLSGSR